MSLLSAAFHYSPPLTESLCYAGFAYLVVLLLSTRILFEDDQTFFSRSAEHGSRSEEAKRIPLGIAPLLIFGILLYNFYPFGISPFPNLNKFFSWIIGPVVIFAMWVLWDLELGQISDICRGIFYTINVLCAVNCLFWMVLFVFFCLQQFGSWLFATNMLLL
jgi:hypothetical protein